MIIEQIKLKNFKCFENYEVTFDKLNVIKGSNGIGKSTIALDSILFGLYGYYDEPLKELPTKGKKKCSVKIKIVKDKNVFEINREYPTSLKIKQNDKLLKFASNRETQEEINKIFGNRESFQKFRMIDNQVGINILELGKTSLRKTLLSVNQSFFNNIRDNLNKKKRERITYNKDTAQVFPHYPSKTRLDLLNAKISNIDSEIRGLQRDINEFNSDLRKISTKKGRFQNSKNYYKTQKEKIYQHNNCPFCERELDEEVKNNLLKKINGQIIRLNSNLDKIQQDMTEQSEALKCVKKLHDDFYQQKNKTNRYINRLESRLKRKDYKYTNQDVLIIKKAIEELDKFYSYFIKNVLNTLEPIINSVIEKIGFTLEFIVDEKGNFDIQLTKDGQKYTYKNLSSGQRLLLSIALKLAILMDRNSTGIVIADEGFSSLDNSNLECVFKLFNNFPFQLVSVLHRTINFDNIKNIELTKEE
ncbi:MAG: AAA family ATPase [Atribacterota bacterium]